MHDGASDESPSTSVAGAHCAHHALDACGKNWATEWCSMLIVFVLSCVAPHAGICSVLHHLLVQVLPYVANIEIVSTEIVLARST